MREGLWGFGTTEMEQCRTQNSSITQTCPYGCARLLGLQIKTLNLRRCTTSDICLWIEHSFFISFTIALVVDFLGQLFLLGCTYQAVEFTYCWQGLMFDLEKESTLYIDIAKSNSRYSRSKRSRTGPLLSLCMLLVFCFLFSLLCSMETK